MLPTSKKLHYLVCHYASIHCTGILLLWLTFLPRYALQYIYIGYIAAVFFQSCALVIYEGIFLVRMVGSGEGEGGCDGGGGDGGIKNRLRDIREME